MRIPDLAPSWDNNCHSAARADRVLAACAVVQLGLLVGWLLNGGGFSLPQHASKMESTTLAASAPEARLQRSEGELHLERIRRLASTPWMGWLAAIESVDVPGVKWEELKVAPEFHTVHLVVSASDADRLSAFVAELQRVLWGQRGEVVPELQDRVNGLTRLRVTIRLG